MAPVSFGDAAGAANAGRCWHETTINQPVGDRIYVAASENNDCCNKPIVSEHPGGSQSRWWTAPSDS